MSAKSDGSIIIDTELDTSGFEKGSNKLKSAMNSLQSSLSRVVSDMSTVPGAMKSQVVSLDKAMLSLGDRVTKAATTAMQGFKSDAQFARFRDNIDISKRQLAALKEQFAALKDTEVPSESFKLYSELVEGAKQSLERLKASQDRLTAAGVDETSESFQKVQAAIESATQRLEEYQAKLKDTPEFEPASEEYGIMANTLGQIEQALGDVEQKGAGAALNMRLMGEQHPMLKLLQGTIKTTAGIIKGALNTGLKAAAGLLRKFRIETVSADNVAKRFVSTLTSLKTMLLSKIKSTFMSTVFGDIKAGIQSLAQYSASFNKSMSNIKNSASQVGGNVAVVFSNLLAAIEPILTKIINLINTALTYINAFFAIFRGGKTITVAKKGMDDYAKSTGGAAKAQKKLNAELYGWDELNRQSKQEDSSGGGGAGGGGIEFEEVPIDDMLPEKLKNWMERLKDAFDMKDWYGMGEIIADGLNQALKAVDDWINNTLRPQGVEWAKRIATILNGLTDKFNWKLLGKTISDGLAAAFDIGATFLETYNFANLGKGLAKAINAIFENKDMWKQAARFFAGAFNAAIDTAWGFIKESLPHMFDWGATLAGALLDMLDGIHWDNLSQTIVGIVDGLIQLIKGFMSDEARWKEVGGKITESFKKTVEGINLGELGTAFSDLLMRVLEYLEGLDWETLGYKVGECLGNIDWPGILASLGGIIVDALWGAVKGFLEGDHGWSTMLMLAAYGLLKTAFGLAVAALSQYLITTALPQLGAAIVAKITGSTIFTTIGGWLSGGAAGAAATAGSVFLAALAGLFIGGEVGKLIDNYIIGPMIEAFDGDQITADLYKNFHWFGEGGFFDEMWDGSEDFYGNVRTWADALGLMFSDLGSGIKSAFENAKTDVSGAMGSMKQDISQKWNDIKSSVSTTLSSMKTDITTKWDGIKSSVSSSITNMKQNAATNWENMKNDAQTKFENIKTSIQNKLQEAESFLKGLNWRQIASDLINGFLGGLKEKWDQVTSWAKEAADGLTSKLKSAFDIHSPSKLWEQIGVFLDEGLTQGLEKGERSMFSTAAGLASGLTDRMTSASGSMTLSTDADIERLGIIQDSLSGIAAIIDHIAAAIASMGGLDIPQIAAGTVVPVRTKVSTSDIYNGGDGDTDDTEISELVQLVRNIRDYLASSGQRGNDVKVVVNGREIFQVVVDENNRAIARTGASPIRV